MSCHTFLFPVCTWCLQISLVMLCLEVWWALDEIFSTYLKAFLKLYLNTRPYVRMEWRAVNDVFQPKFVSTWFVLPRAVLELVWVQALELGFPRHLLATRIPTMTMIIMLRIIMPTSMTTITITQMIRMRRMTFVKTYSRESSSLQLMVTQIFHELQMQMSFALVSLILSCLFFSYLSLSCVVHTQRIQSGRTGRY